MSITKARELVVRHHRYAWFLTLAAILIVSSAYFKKDFVSAATYYFTQASWSTLDDVGTANHTSNRTGWVKYTNKSASLSAGDTLSLSSTSYAFTDDGATSTLPTAPTTGGGFTLASSNSTTHTANSDFTGTNPINTQVANGSVSLGISSTAATAEIPASESGLVNLWHMNEGTGQTTADSKGATTGTLGGTTGAEASDPTWITSGKFSNALSFDGVDDYVAHTFTSYPVDNFTMEFWANPTATIAIQTEATSGTSGVSGQRYAIEPVSGGTHGGAGVSVGTNGIAVYERGSSYLPPLAVYSGTLPAGWNHIAVVYNNRQPSIYLNGSLVRTGLTSLMSMVHAPRLQAQIGKGEYGAFAGSIDDVAIYDQALTASTIAGHNGAVYFNLGTYTSQVVNIGQAVNFSTLSYGVTTPANTSISIDIRAGNTATPGDGTWTAWQTGIASGGSIAALNGNQYIQYRANLSSNTVYTPSLDSITINYNTVGATGSNVTVSGTGPSASVRLAIDAGTGADGALDLSLGGSAGGCSGTGLAWASPTCTINTDTKSTFNFTAITIPSGTTLTATGATFLTLKATGSVTVAGIISLNGGTGGDGVFPGAYGVAGTAGAGGSAGMAGSGLGGSSSNGCSSSGPGGGGGFGGNGGCSNATYGRAYDVANAGGSGGGRGGTYGNGSNYAGGGGGGGGGSMRIISTNQVAVSGTVSSNGGRGGWGASSSGFSGAPGGGGSGGRIVIIATDIVNSGSITANGGSGLSADASPLSGGGGGGRITLSDSDGVVAGTITATGATGTTNSGANGVVVKDSNLGYYSSGTFTSTPIGLGAPSGFAGKTLTWSETLPSGTDIQIQMRSASTEGGLSSATWYGPTGTGDWYTASGGSINTIHDGARWVQYKAVLTSPSPYNTTPLLNSVTINYAQYLASADLTSSAYNTESGANIMGGLTWTEDATLPSGTSAAIQLKTASSYAGLSGASWSSGITSATSGCSKSGTTVTCGASAIPAGLKDGVGDQWFQYKIALTSSDGSGTPTVDNIQVTYVVNAPPAFDPLYGTNGVTVSQLSDSANANWGKVEFSYRIKDEDTTTGTTNPGYVTPSFEYSTNGGSSWTAIPSGDLSALATTNKAVSEGSYTTYTAYWTATSTLSGANAVGVANAKIRVTINDNEALNNTAVAASANFTLDTAAPAVGGGHFTLDSSTGGATAGTLILTATDYGNLQYRFCNDSTFPATDTQGNSCAWSSLGASVASTTNATWVPTGYPNSETVYMQARDLYGSVTAQSAIAPATPTNLLNADVSNPSANSYGESLSWLTVPSAASYRVYSAYTATNTTVPSSYNLLASPTTNVYSHTITTATTSAYWYKVAAASANGDISNFTTETERGDVPDSFGTTLPDTAAPVITQIAVPEASRKSTSAVVTFTTDELAAATVLYGTSYSVSCSYGSTVSANAYVTSQSVTLPNLAAGTTYYFCVKAADVLGNMSNANDATLVGGTFATAGGPTISNVTVNDRAGNSATILWNTATSSDSYVYYSTSNILANPITKGSTSMVSCASPGVCQHQVGLTGLTAGTTYYFKVKSTDSESNSVTDTNSGSYYSFSTLQDTTPPTITGTSTPVLSPTAVVVVWTTDEPATSKIDYGISSGAYTKGIAEDPTLSIYHVETLSSSTYNSGSESGNNALTAETAYYYRVTSKDAAGNSASSEGTFTTPNTGAVTITTIVRRAAAEEGIPPDTTAPIISNVKVSAITPFSATVSFDTDEAAVSFAEYAKGGGDTKSEGNSTYGTSHSLKLSGLTLGTEYQLRVKAVDKAGNTATGGDQTFKTSFLSENIKELTKIENIEQFQKEIEETIESILPSLVPPFVSKPTVTDITENSATVSFRTNIRSFPLVGFVEDVTYDASAENPYSSEVSDTTEKRTDHTLSLLNLKPNTKYHIQARAFSLPQVVGKSDDITFTTKASKIQASIVETKRDSFTVVWITDEPTTSTVEYKNLATGITERKTDSKQTSSHSMKIENLPSATTYDVTISGVNAGGNVIEGGSPLRVTTSKDVTPPVLSNFKVSNAMVPGRTDRIQTIISWTTDEPADSVVYYEEGIGTPGDEKELANKSEITDSLTTNHNIIISSLKPGAIYRIKVTSTDDSGNIGIFGPRTIITPKQTESITDIIFKNFEDSFKFLRNF